MRTIRTIAEVRGLTARARAAGRTIALVPTMGAFHAGHLALMRAARRACDEVVVSLFVNPSQFEDTGDLAAYPRDEPRDAALAAEAGVDALFAPSVGEMYPPRFSTTVRVDGPGDAFEGAVRGPGHFASVATVVCKLFNIVGPDVAVFGAKDAQQVAVLRRMATDLDIPVRLDVVDTVREADGLALSSRNAHLSPAERAQALALVEGLRAAQALAAAGTRDPASLVDAARSAMAARSVRPDYVTLVDPDTFEPVHRADGRALIAVAARIGTTRLIDNLLIDLHPTEAATG